MFFFSQGTVVKASTLEYNDKSITFYIRLKKQKKHLLGLQLKKSSWKRNFGVTSQDFHGYSNG